MDFTLTYYLSGPMSGYPDHNFPAFEVACKHLREMMGLSIVSPHELEGEKDQPYMYYIKRDLDLIKKSCRGVILLPGWAGSKGVVRYELPLAHRLNLPVYYLNDQGGLNHMGGGGK